MTIKVRGPSDRIIDAIVDALRPYGTQHREARIEVYRHNSVSVRIRIVDPEFAAMSRVERNDLIWKYFVSLPDEIQSDITMLVLLAPDERPNSLANFEFEHPVPSKL